MKRKAIKIFFSIGDERPKPAFAAWTLPVTQFVELRLTKLHFYPTTQQASKLVDTKSRMFEPCNCI
jgi:hypothetical protein